MREKVKLSVLCQCSEWTLSWASARRGGAESDPGWDAANLPSWGFHPTPSWRITHGPSTDDLFPTWHYYLTWIKTATTECSQDWMPVELSSVQTWAACSELRPWEMQIKLEVCCPTRAITASLEAVIKSWGEMDALRKIQGVRTPWLAHGWTCFKFNHISPFPLPANASPGSVLADPISFGRVHNLGWSSCIKLWVSLQHHLLAFKENSSEILREGRRQCRQVIQPYKIPGLWFQPAFHAGAARGTWAVWLARASNQKVPQAYKVY